MPADVRRSFISSRRDCQAAANSSVGFDEDAGVTQPPFVPPEFVPPSSLVTDRFRLEPLGPQHNDSDYEAWSSSVEHIHATPGWETSSWPDDRSLDHNLRDLRRHADDFEKRRGFTYTVLDPAGGEVIGCLYIYPDEDEQHDARVLSWVTASRAELDVPLWRAVTDWLERDWPFERVAYAARADSG
jgi:RimJ/RimL family protein N-acetyltransferase